MKISAVASGNVVRNAKNGNHYRTEPGSEERKSRIRSLELFPNGLLIPKPTPTTIDADIEVVVIGEWVEDMVVEGKPTASRRTYENELMKLEARLPELETAYDALPKSGTGKVSRGSWANKVKSCRGRIAVLRRGLGFVDASQMLHAPVEVAEVGFEIEQWVQAPSGRMAQVMGFQPMGNDTYVTVRTRLRGQTIEASLPGEVLRPAGQARLCTV